MPFDQGPLLQHRRARNVVNDLHRMRIAHGDDRDKHRDFATVLVQAQRPFFTRIHALRLQPGRIERHALQIELRRVHVHAHAPVGQSLQREHAVHGAHPNHVLVTQAVLAHELEETARAVAAVLHFLAIRVVNHVFEIDVRTRRRPHAQDLVGADTKMPVRQLPVLRAGQAQQPTRLVEHDKVVARALHFGEVNLHGAIICDRPAQQALPVTKALHYFATWLSLQGGGMPLNTQPRIHLTALG